MSVFLFFIIFHSLAFLVFSNAFLLMDVVILVYYRTTLKLNPNVINLSTNLSSKWYDWKKKLFSILDKYPQSQLYLISIPLYKLFENVYNKASSVGHSWAPVDKLVLVAANSWILTFLFKILWKHMNCTIIVLYCRPSYSIEVKREIIFSMVNTLLK